MFGENFSCEKPRKRKSFSLNFSALNYYDVVLSRNARIHTGKWMEWARWQSYIHGSKKSATTTSWCAGRDGMVNEAKKKWRMNKQENWFRMFFSSCCCCCCWMQRILRVISLNFQFNFLPYCLLNFAFSCNFLLSLPTTTTTMRRRENVNMAIHMHMDVVVFSYTRRHSHFQIVTIEIDLLNYESTE